MPNSNPEFSQNPIPSLQEITEAYSDILQHNSEYAGIGALRKRFGSDVKSIGVITDPDNPDSAYLIGDNGYLTNPEKLLNADGEKQPVSINEGDMRAAMLDLIHGDTFLRAGIILSPIGPTVVNHEGKVLSSAEIVPEIDDIFLYLKFLNKLQPEDVHNKTAEQFFCDIVINLSLQTYSCFDPENIKKIPEEDREGCAEEGEEMLRDFIAFDPDYARLGLDGDSWRNRLESVSKELAHHLRTSGPYSHPPFEIQEEHTKYLDNHRKLNAYENMNKFVQFWGRDLLPEYIEASRGKYLTDPTEQKKGPAYWHIHDDQYKWRDAIDFVGRLDQEERTQSFAAEVREALITSIKAAIAELPDPDIDEFSHRHAYNLENISKAILGKPFNRYKYDFYTTKHS